MCLNSSFHHCCQLKTAGAFRKYVYSQGEGLVLEVASTWDWISRLSNPLFGSCFHSWNKRCSFVFPEVFVGIIEVYAHSLVLIRAISYLQKRRQNQTTSNESDTQTSLVLAFQIPFNNRRKIYFRKDQRPLQTISVLSFQHGIRSNLQGV